MNKYQKTLQEVADIISKYSTCELKVNRRNGYYAVDEYHNTKYMGYLKVGDYKEVYNFLFGMRYMLLILKKK